MVNHIYEYMLQATKGVASSDHLILRSKYTPVTRHRWTSCNTANDPSGYLLIVIAVIDSYWESSIDGHSLPSSMDSVGYLSIAIAVTKKKKINSLSTVIAAKNALL